MNLFGSTLWQQWLRDLHESTGCDRSCVGQEPPVFRFPHSHEFVCWKKGHTWSLLGCSTTPHCSCTIVASPRRCRAHHNDVQHFAVTQGWKYASSDLILLPAQLQGWFFFHLPSASQAKVWIFSPHCKHPAYKTGGWLKWWQQPSAMRSKEKSASGRTGWKHSS